MDDHFGSLFECSTNPCHCLCCLAILVITMWTALSVNLVGQYCYLHEFYVPALDLSQNSTSNNTNTINPCLFFDIAFQNVLTDHSVRYGDVNVTFSYGRSEVANYVVPTFYQGQGTTVNAREVVETNGLQWLTAAKAVLNNGSAAVFRVDLVARPRVKLWFWYPRRKRMRVGADVEVDGSGMKMKKEDTRLKSAASKGGIRDFVMFASLLVTLLCLF
ncbi:hypothetical protein MIMGU_mgv1a018062mg [Erythranthe guttata]|uniref:Late embryogenesis abundant protein LEA-2 subgroup domain-containing protein n=1 Tax=Erythranthe guttata TaxID=4155 RepID=A0A022QCA0_ERYGU|nr:hypothetical protein MIMGU_mgv1a018062mg [Erythranthe guttata]